MAGWKATGIKYTAAGIFEPGVGEIAVQRNVARMKPAIDALHSQAQDLCVGKRFGGQQRRLLGIRVSLGEASQVQSRRR